MIKKQLLITCLLFSTFCQAKIEQTLSNGKPLTIFQDTDTLIFTEGVRIAFKDFLQNMRTVSYNEFDQNMHNLVESLPIEKRNQVVSTMANFEAFTQHLCANKEFQNFWQSKYQRPYFIQKDLKPSSFEEEKIIEKIVATETEHIAYNRFFYCSYQGNYYLVSGVSTHEEVFEIFESLLTSL